MRDPKDKWFEAGYLRGAVLEKGVLGDKLRTFRVLMSQGPNGVAWAYTKSADRPRGSCLATGMEGSITEGL